MEDVASLLRRHWGLLADDVTPLDGGMNSTTWLVEHEGATYVAKQVPRDSLRQLAQGCEVASLLAESGLVTGRPVPTSDGSLVVSDPALALLEHVPGRELVGESDEEQRWIAGTLARVHVAGGPVDGPATSDFFRWLSPEARGVEMHPWLAPAIDVVRAETDSLTVTWSMLHTDPAPEAFRRDESSGVTGLIDWTGSRRGPVLYDVASAVMYLGGPNSAAAFLDTYRAQSSLGLDELQLLDAFRRFRWAVQAAYFAGRLAAGDLTGIADADDNHRGLVHARRGLAELGVDVA